MLSYVTTSVKYGGWSSTYYETKSSGDFQSIKILPKGLVIQRLTEGNRGEEAPWTVRFQGASPTGGVKVPLGKKDRSEGHVPLETDALFGVVFFYGWICVLKRQMRNVERQLVAMAGKEPVQARGKFLTEVSTCVGVRIDV